MHQKKVLVVGTTPDYIDLLRKTMPGKVVFLTDTAVRDNAKEPCPQPNEEILVESLDFRKSMGAITLHRAENRYWIHGIACFDCESMELAALIAGTLKLPFPGLSAIKVSRDKHLSKEWWQTVGLDTPVSKKIFSEAQAVEFFVRTGGECVLKPVQGSGSEHVFKCSTIGQCQAAYRTIVSKRNSPVAVAEHFIKGTEYSCDFIADGNTVQLIRLARKIKFGDGVFGTVNGYELTESLPGNISQRFFESILNKASSTLGLSGTICMLDFIIQGNRIVLLEIAPRPGGDCLPWLIKKATGVDVLDLTVALANQTSARFPKPDMSCRLVGLRIHAKESGVLKQIDTERLLRDPRVREVYFRKKEGDRITLPPDDYDSWTLGHIIFRPSEFVDLEQQCRDLLSRVTIEMEKKYDVHYFGIHGAFKNRAGNKHIAA